MKVKKETRELQCHLNDDEMLAYGTELAELNAKIFNIEQTKKDVAKDYQNRIDTEKARVNLCSDRIWTKKEPRDIKCHWNYDWQKGKKTLYRTDTAEVVEVKKIDEWERQTTMDAAVKEEELIVKIDSSLQ